MAIFCNIPNRIEGPLVGHPIRRESLVFSEESWLVRPSLLFEASRKFGERYTDEDYFDYCPVGWKEKSPENEEEVQGDCLPLVSRSTPCRTRLNTCSTGMRGAEIC